MWTAWALDDDGPAPRNGIFCGRLRRVAVTAFLSKVCGHVRFFSWLLVSLGLLYDKNEKSDRQQKRFSRAVLFPGFFEDLWQAAVFMDLVDKWTQGDTLDSRARRGGFATYLFLKSAIDGWLEFYRTHLPLSHI
jgi:hypothetical protein